MWTQHEPQAADSDGEVQSLQAQHPEGVGKGHLSLVRIGVGAVAAEGNAGSVSSAGWHQSHIQEGGDVRSVFAFLLLCSTAFADLEFARIDTGDATGIPPVLTTWRDANPAGYWAWGVTAWDYDNDHYADLICTSHGTIGSKFFRNNADGTFTDVTATIAVGIPANKTPHTYRPVLIDVDGDGAIDLLGSAEGRLPVLLNRVADTGKLQRVTLEPQAVSEKFGYVTDFLHDGWNDWTQHDRAFGVTKTSDYTNNHLNSFTRNQYETPRPPGLPPDIIAKLDAARNNMNNVNKYSGPLFWSHDLNGDGNLDTVIQYGGSYNAAPNSQFRWGWYSVDTGISANVIPLEIRDMNKDGLVDIFCGYGLGSGLWLQQPAGGGFVLVQNGDLNAALRDPNLIYQPEWHFEDFDRDGDLDFLLGGSRAKWTEVYDNRGGGQFVRVFRAYSWDAQGWAVGDFNRDLMTDIAIGGRHVPGAITQNNTEFCIYYNTIPCPVPTPIPPKIALRHPLEGSDKTTPEAVRFLAWCDSYFVNPRLYGMEAFHMALAYRMTGDDKYADAAELMVLKMVRDADANIVLGVIPPMAYDSYLYVHTRVRSLLYTCRWCGHLMDRDLVTAAERYARQGVWNVWHPKEATWQPFLSAGGAKLQKWSGWALNLPRNNYHFSFVGATMLMGLYDGSKATIEDAAKAVKVLVDAHSYDGGGSGEGTGYGLAHQTLLEVWSIWQDSTRGHPEADILKVGPFVCGSLDYWTNATMPGFRLKANIGDQALESVGQVSDHMRDIMIQSLHLNKGLPVDPSVDAWLAARPKMLRGEFFYQDMLKRPAQLGQPTTTALSYTAAEVGHHFARSSWEPDAVTLVSQCGEFPRGGHAHQSNGAFDLWGYGGWLTSGQNMRTNSGIRQDTFYHNMIRFEFSGVPLQQKVAARGIAATTDDGSVWHAEYDLSGLYPGQGIYWNRRLTFTRPDRLLIQDECLVPPDGVKAILQLQFPTQPTVDGTSITAPHLEINVVSDDTITASAVEWKTLSPDNLSGWRVDVSGSLKYETLLKIVP
jgi:hypothetical protein